MASNITVQSMLPSSEYSEELGAFLRERSRNEVTDLERDLNIYRSGSAPPTVEGSLTAVGGLFGNATRSLGFDDGVNGKGVVTEDDFRSDPAYVSYYYSNVNLNPRLPPPLMSKEDWRFAQRLKSGGTGSVLGGIGDRRKINRARDVAEEPGCSNISMFSPQLGMGDFKVEKAADWGEDGLIGLPGLGGRKKSIAEIIQDDLNQTTCPPMYSSRPVSRNNVESSDNHFSNAFSVEEMSTSTTPTPAPLLPPRAPSPCLRNVDSPHLFADDMAELQSENLITAFSEMEISRNDSLGNHLPCDAKSTLSTPIGNSDTGPIEGLKSSNNPSRNHSRTDDMEADAPRHGASPNRFHRGPVNNSAASQSQYQNWDSPNSFPGYGLNNYASLMGNQLGVSNLPPLYENAAASAMGVNAIDSMGMGGSYLSGANLMAATELQSHSGGMPFVDPLYLHYLRSADYATALNDPPLDRGYMNTYDDLVSRSYMSGLLSPQKSQFDSSYISKSGIYYGNAAAGLGMPLSGMGLIFPPSPQRAGSSLRNVDRNMRFASSMRGLSGSGMGTWQAEMASLDDRFALSLLDEFKSNKTKCFDLSEIVDHVVEFSADQYGSRFIQQKLETATCEEKDMVFHEIMPQALSLMTDVFGNYVVQKFFEHGSASQIRELAEQLTGHVLALSLQMYGCRVIQKAIEVAEFDQQTRMVAELDGHVMRCVRDQNGNHVIQKCIECIPEDAIQFIISTFYDQVMTLSTHPYGCRVIQRVLEHCNDPQTQSIMIDEILRSVCLLTEDQYGNYVVQHVLEHGKPHERSAIIKKLTGRIVHMSQQKFASNVIEKCLSFGDSVERRLLVNEMLGSTDENEPLQAMMKDQFGNYVVQKVLETCDDQQLELILNRIKVHLSALKKYTYGKHIVARVEKLVAAGERRISVLSLQPSSIGSGVP